MGTVASRRQFLDCNGLGIGSIALTHLMQSEKTSASTGGIRSPVHLRAPQTASAAKAMILLVQTGAPSQMDLFDPKPNLQKRDGIVHSEKVEAFQTGSETNRLMASPYRFRKYGECGMDFSGAVPHLASQADDICMVRSMYTENNNHPQGLRMVHTGKIFAGRPTLGSWICYGLGTENQNLPAYAVLRSPTGYSNGGTALWDSGWLPAAFRGTEIQTEGPPFINLHPAQKRPEGAQRNTLDLLSRLNRKRQELYPNDTRLSARIANYELAARMQVEAEELLDLSSETQETQRLYGMDNETTRDYGTRCLMARRLVEAGVRFVQILTPNTNGFMPWDQHRNLVGGIDAIAAQVDRPSAALISDLRSRGLLDETIVMWSGEFGRLPISQNKTGRDHNRHAFSLLLAGGGFRSGCVHGATDELGYRAVEQRVSCPDLHATLLHQLGLDHEALTYLHNGREETLTDSVVSEARVVTELLRSSGTTVQTS
ncbi:MAG: DUF1501 domain-containing protein [Fuerstiella sp.]|nr:DUF1501 domain-containing protein [Fuerstiella sp.]